MTKEELFMSECRFFTRLDVRIATLSTLFQNMENVMVATAGAKKSEQEKIDKFHKDCISLLLKNDIETNDFYSKLMEEEENETT